MLELLLCDCEVSSLIYNELPPSQREEERLNAESYDVHIVLYLDLLNTFQLLSFVRRTTAYGIFFQKGAETVDLIVRQPLTEC